MFPSDVAKAEVRTIAEGLCITPRDVGFLLMVLVKPGNFNEGEVLYKYHLQKLLFYLWKDLEKSGFSDSLPRDEFIPAENGPKPEHLDEDLKKFEDEKLIITKCEKWKEGVSKRIILTKEGLDLAQKLWENLPEPYKVVAMKVKEKIYPLDPETVRHKVHKEYPEYRDSYIKNDIE